MSGIRSESLVMVSPEVSQAVPLRSRAGCLVAVVVKPRPRGRGCAGRPSLVKPGGSSGGKRALPTRGKYARLLSRLRWHATETNDYPGLPRIAERHQVARASYLLRQPNTRQAEWLCPWG